MLNVADLEEVESMLNNSLNWAQKMKAEGRQEGRLELLSSQLAEKFGSELAASFAGERLLNASTQQVDFWARRILHAKTIDEVFDS
ncbi:MAG: hypothetical protein LBP22_02565 [Deltaproteobacteria bacterium]|nr:hypothetical protein [Deltaproteobacteria bacterium]